MDHKTSRDSFSALWLAGRRLLAKAAFAAGLAVLPLALSVGTGAAGNEPPQLDRLLNYLGDWRGTGELVGGEEPETFTCRLNMAKGNQVRINYTGRCALLSRNLSVSGTIAFNETSNKFEAAMTSNAGFAGKAVGRIEGENIIFDLRGNDQDEVGNDLDIGAVIILQGPQIVVNFEVEFNDSGRMMTAHVPFSQ